MTTRRIIVFGICAFLVAGSGCAKRVLVDAAIDSKVYNRIAIMPFTTEGTVFEIGSQLADEVTLKLLAEAPQIQIVESTKINVLTLPENLKNGARSREEIAIALGQLLRVDAVLTGTVTVALADVSPSDWPRRVGNAAAVVRLIDVDNGRVVWAEREETEFTDTRFDLSSSTWHTDYDITQNVIRDLAERIAQNFYPHYERR
jgi:hypothetical protein